MKIRYATENDDFNVLARLMYETDRYIYPYWFEENKDEGIKVIAELMKQENTSFYYKKCLVAEIDGKIVGMLVYFNKECPLDFKYSKIIDKNFNYNYTLTKYFIPLEKSVEENETYVAGTSSTTGKKLTDVSGFTTGQTTGEGLVLENQEIIANSRDNYKLRIWISDDVDYSNTINGQDEQTSTGKFNGYKYSYNSLF